MVSEVKIRKYINDKVLEEDDTVVDEHKVNIFINGEYYDSLTCLRRDLDELAVGRLFSEGVIGDGLDGNKLPEIKSRLTVSPDEVVKMAAAFNGKSELFQKTGAVHCCSLIFPDGANLFYEDILRHNAIDKAIGKALIEGRCMENGILLTSGRISSEILIKAARFSIPIIISISAPTNTAVGIAEKINMTLIGFARDGRFNVYSGGQRILS